jgi:hypothetical protein
MFLSNPYFLLFSALSPLTQVGSFAAQVAGPPLGAAEASLNASIQSLLGSTSLTSTILQNFLAPLAVEVARNSYVMRDGTALKLNSVHWTASGANVYWLGLDENVIPPTGQPFYAKLNASYPTHGRITEVMNTLATMGARTIRSQTLGVSVGNPLSVMPALGVYNEQAFDTIDWAVFQARQHGLRIMAPLVDNYDYYHGGKFDFLRFRGFNVSSANKLRRSSSSHAVLHQRHNCPGLQGLYSASHHTCQSIHWFVICGGPHYLRLRDWQRTRWHPLWGHGCA